MSPTEEVRRLLSDAADLAHTARKAARSDSERLAWGRTEGAIWDVYNGIHSHHDFRA